MANQQQQHPPKPTSNPQNVKVIPLVAPFTMPDAELRALLGLIQHSLRTKSYKPCLNHLNYAKLYLLQLDALIPSPQTPQPMLLLARETFELGALLSIRLQDASSFTRYFAQLQPFYDLPAWRLPREGSNQSKITGLHLLLLLSQGDYAGFHTVLESLELVESKQEFGLQQQHQQQQQQQQGQGAQERSTPAMGEDDVFIQYPVKLEEWLMEGSYDKVWAATKGEKVPSEEYGIFSEVLIGTIRSEIASCSEKAYPSLPITDAKSLLFFESEGRVVEFARRRGWAIRDGRIYFPAANGDQGLAGTERESSLLASEQVIENTIGYARELETIV
ncbi:MAG: regulatory particle non-ATPase [Peltula sp. TS41687]|nr:MAG: regulatory particle non-ATPase [Peltula sp. TS41687]